MGLPSGIRNLKKMESPVSSTNARKEPKLTDTLSLMAHAFLSCAPFTVSVRRDHPGLPSLGPLKEKPPEHLSVGLRFSRPIQGELGASCFGFSIQQTVEAG